jgi:hypothetical protein
LFNVLRRLEALLRAARDFSAEEIAGPPMAALLLWCAALAAPPDAMG